MNKLYFSGFSLKNEKDIFEQFIVNNNFTVNGFSYGAIKAFEYVINSDKRVDKLQLFSPAYFNDKDKKYKRMQLMFFKKDPALYCDKFLNNSGFSTDMKNQYFSMGTYQDLDQLLNYEWKKENMEIITNRNIKLEVYIGEKDKIIDPQNTLEFFKNYGEVYFLKDAGHILSN